MKVEIQTQELNSVLGKVQPAVGPTDLLGHVKFQVSKEDGVCFAANNFLFARCPFATCSVEGAPFEFTVEFKRLKQLLGASSSPTVTLEVDGADVDAQVGEGSVAFQSYVASTFPSLDRADDAVVYEWSVKASTLSSWMKFLKPFLFDDETKKPEFCVMEIVNGSFMSANGLAFARIKSDTFKGSSLRVFSKDVSGVSKFLALAEDGDEVVISEMPHATRFTLPNGASLVESKFQRSFPLFTDRNDKASANLVVSREALSSVLNIVRAGAAGEESNVSLKLENGQLSLGMLSPGGKMCESWLPVSSEGSCAFKVSLTGLLGVLAQWGEDLVITVCDLGKGSGYMTVSMVDGSDTHTVILVFVR